MNKYQQQKQMAREEAIKWQAGLSYKHYSWDELVDWQNYFERLAKCYGLLQEFRENGIC